MSEKSFQNQNNIIKKITFRKYYHLFYTFLLIDCFLKYLECMNIMFLLLELMISLSLESI